MDDSGIGFLGLLTLILITAKLFGKLDWSWIWILSPIWIPILVVVLIVIIGIVILLCGN